ncbi:MAPEG family-domain-containing protein [Podospora australis]|uniref:MAPEG family-domain-containing protein n=1 Tax=Podospora australis TaxID=1536484 RepID=A0AAN7AG85_9PEZI|nr:MAPEG family-domain-containing protein [Podospora australis]
MSYTARVGLNHIDVVGPLLPVTGSFLLPFTAYFGLLSTRVVLQRLSSNCVLGTEVKGAEDPVQKKKQHELLVATRSQANFVEHVPLALLMAAIAELNGARKQILTLTLGGLLAARVIHVELGMRRPESTGAGRAVGYYGTLGAMGFLAGYAGFLVKDYWGF